MDYEKKYWDDIYARIKNEYGTAALMGNLKAESGFIPYRKQNDNTPPYDASMQYTAAVDDGTYSENSFVNDSVGYGVAQWTYSSRKQNMYTLHVQHSESIGSYELSIRMLFFELDGGYISTKEVLMTATEVDSASNYVLHNYEQPYDQSEAVEKYRAQLGREIYEKYAGGSPGPPDPPDPPDPPGPKPKRNGMPLWFYLIPQRHH